MMITVNGRKYVLKDGTAQLDYRGVCTLAGLPETSFVTVTYYVPGGEQRGKSLFPGQSVQLEPEMVFNAANTSNA